MSLRDKILDDLEDYPIKDTAMLLTGLEIVAQDKIFPWKENVIYLRGMVRKALRDKKSCPRGKKCPVYKDKTMCLGSCPMRWIE